MKVLSVLALLVAGVVSQCISVYAQDCTSAPAGLVGWWSADGPSEILPGNRLAVNDWSGQGNHGSGTNLVFANGKVNAGFQFDGRNTSITIPASPRLDVRSLTFAAWINPTDYANRPILGYGDDFVGVMFGVNLGINNNAPGALAANIRQGLGIEHTLMSPNVIATNEWSFVALTYDYVTSIGRLYANGQVVQESYLGFFVPMIGTPLNIGGGESPGIHFAGKMDEVQVYNRDLSPEELNTIYKAGSAGVCKTQPVPLPHPNGLAAYYPLNGTALDFSGNGLDGTIVGASAVPDRFGNGKGALQFNGISDYVNLGNRFNFESNFTLNAWVQLTNQSAYAYILGKYYYAGQFVNVSHSYGLGTEETGRNPYAFVLGDGHFYSEVRSSSVLADAKWHSLSMVYDRAFGAKLYMDGQAIGSTYAPGLPPFTNSYPLFIGKIASGFNFRGNIDDVSLYNVALSGEEIAQLYRQQAMPVEFPKITSQPASVTVEAGGFAQFLIEASGSEPLRYQWNLNGQALANATNSFFVVANAQSTDAGTYTVMVSNAAGSTTSSGAVLIVVPPSPPQITSQPESKTVFEGNDVTFRVLASGAAVLGYQWRFNSNDIAGATSASLTLTNVHVAEAGEYTVRVSNTAGSVSSAPAMLTVLVPDRTDCTPVPPGLVGWWSADSSLEELSGSQLNANDWSGYGNHALGSDLSFVIGKVNGAFGYNGETTTLNVPQSTSLSVTSLTFTAWINPSGMEAVPIIDYGDEGSYVGAHFWINTEAFTPAPGHLYANLREAWGKEFIISVPDVITNNVWTLVAVSYDYSTGLGRLYVNGQLVKETNFGFFRPDTRHRLSIGHRLPGIADGGGYNGAHFGGKMDEVQIYNRALSPAEMAAIYGAGSAGHCRTESIPLPHPEGLAAYYPLNGTALDFSGNGLDGTIVGARTVTDRFGNEKGALQFNGISDYVNLGNRFNFESNFTLNAWVQLTSQSAYSYILGKYSTGPSENVSHSYGLGTEETGRSPYAFVLGDGHSYSEVRSSSVLADAKWHSLSMVYDRAFGAKLYMDGRVIGTTYAPGLPPFTNSYPLFIAKIASGFNFQGNIDDVSLYNVALSSAELAQLYRQQASDLPVDLQNATATFSQSAEGDFSPARAIDGVTTDNLGWAIYPNIQNQTAVFETRSDVGFEGGTQLTFSLLSNHKSVRGSTGHTLGRFRLSVTTDSRDRFADGLATDGDVSANWSVVDVLSAKSQSGATLTVLADGSVLVSGPLTEVDLYTVVAGTRLTGITGVRIEALTDPSLPNGGPGREPLNGNFVLSEFNLSVRPGLVPEVISQPSSVTVPVGDSAQFKVSASSSSALKYQWFWNGRQIAGATNSSYAVASASFADAGTYSVAVSSSGGSTASSGAVLNVIPVNATNAATLFVSNRTPTNAPIFDIQGNALAGARYLAQIYSAGTDRVFRPSGPAVPFLTGTNAGYFEPIDLLLPDVAPGDRVSVTLFIWDSVAGVSYEEAVANQGARGRSEVLVSATGGGGLPTPQLEGLKSFSLVAPPRVTLPPTSTTVYVGDDVTLRVQASGSTILDYQWRFNSNDIAGATSTSLTLTNVQLANAGEYTVRVSNSAGDITSEPAVLTVLVPDRTSPTILISSPTEQNTFDDVVTLSGSITDNVAIATTQWARDGSVLAPLVLNDGRFSMTNIALVRGTNIFRIQATDTSGNESSALVIVVLQASRTLSVGQVPAIQEGSRVTVPVQLVSRGDVSGIAFTLGYDRNYLENPEVTWGEQLGGAFVQVNTNTLGGVRASFALSGVTLPAGTQTVCSVTFHARSVPANLKVPLMVSGVGVFSVTGDSLTSGTEIFPGMVGITKRKYAGDNNANDRLDVGDASAIMRLVTLLEAPRLWDTSANDLNRNQLLDVGDVIRVLRSVVGLDPQPGATGSVSAASIHAFAAKKVLAAMSLDKQQAAPGEKVKLTVNLGQFQGPVSGFSFRLRYPVGALRLDNAQAHRLGSIVPANAVALWNVSPVQNDYANQDGTVSVAVSTDGNWQTNSGPVAEFTFTVQSGETNQYRWPIQLSALEVSSGYELVAGTDSVISFTGRDPLPSTIQGGINPVDGTFTISLAGEGAGYVIEISEDLQTWTELSGSAGNPSESIVDPETNQKKYRFYRAKLVE